MDDGTVVASHISRGTIARRFKKAVWTLQREEQINLDDYNDDDMDDIQAAPHNPDYNGLPLSIRNLQGKYEL